MSNHQTLRDLVLKAVDRHDTSGRQLAMIAQGHGFDITVTTINHLKAGTYKYKPSAETIRAIAWLAGVDDAVAFAAAGQPIPGPPLSDELPPGADNLSPKSRKAILEMVRVLVDLEAGSDAQYAPNDRTKSRSLRAVAPEGDARPGQKTDSPSTYEAEDALDQHGVTQISGAEAESIPVPPLEQLAAHHNFKSEREKWEEVHGERGEENQDAEEDPQ